MPFTFAHPAAAVPFMRLMGRHGVLSALVIGSIVPDLGYIVPMHITRHQFHSVSGLFMFCVPLGLMVYLIFHLFLKGPLLSLAPHLLFVRLGWHVARFNSMPAFSWLSVILCLFVGSCTHLLWDAFTHRGGAGVALFPALYTIFHFGDFTIFAYKLLQHVSSLLGITVLLSLLARFLNNADEDQRALPFMLTALQRNVAVAILLVVPTMVGTLSGLARIDTSHFLFEAQKFAAYAALGALPILMVMLLLYGCWWHSRRWCE